jgi:hypothetical protein
LQIRGAGRKSRKTTHAGRGQETIWEIPIDTTAMVPTLTHTAIERCGIDAIPSENFTIGISTKVVALKATKVTVCLAQDFTIHWQSVSVLPIGFANPADTSARLSDSCSAAGGDRHEAQNNYADQMIPTNPPETLL